MNELINKEQNNVLKCVSWLIARILKKKTTDKRRAECVEMIEQGNCSEVFKRKQT